MVLWAPFVRDSAAGSLVALGGNLQAATVMGSIGLLDLLACVGCHASVSVVLCLLRIAACAFLCAGKASQLAAAHCAVDKASALLVDCWNADAGLTWARIAVCVCQFAVSNLRLLHCHCFASAEALLASVDYGSVQRCLVVSVAVMLARWCQLWEMKTQRQYPGGCPLVCCCCMQPFCVPFFLP